jgi:hypothetical protein
MKKTIGESLAALLPRRGSRTRGQMAVFLVRTFGLP